MNSRMQTKNGSVEINSDWDTEGKAGPSAGILDLVEQSEKPQDKLDAIRAKLARVRDLRLSVLNWEKSIKEANKELQTLTFQELPEMFQTSGVRTLGLNASENLPAYDAEIKPFYRANIAADWNSERRDTAFTLLQQRDAGDLIKSQVTVEFDRGQLDDMHRVTSALEKLGVQYTAALSVHWGTLTSWLRERYEHKKGLTPGELEMIGATVATIVEVKPRKEK